MEIPTQRQVSFLPSQSLPGLTDCVRDQCYPQSRGRGHLIITETPPIVSKAYQSFAGSGGHNLLFSLNPLASSLTAKRLQPPLPTAATWHHFGLCSCTFGTWWLAQIWVRLSRDYGSTFLPSCRCSSVLGFSFPCCHPGYSLTCSLGLELLTSALNACPKVDSMWELWGAQGMPPTLRD